MNLYTDFSFLCIEMQLIFGCFLGIAVLWNLFILFFVIEILGFSACKSFCCSMIFMSDSLWPCGQQLARLPYPSLSSRVYSNSYSLSQWCHSTVSSSVAPSPIALEAVLDNFFIKFTHIKILGGRNRPVPPKSFNLGPLPTATHPQGSCLLSEMGPHKTWGSWWAVTKLHLAS